ncbi:methyltransferase [Herbiconiux moechotypicola]|uniref:Methyltransferase small domain-containing protein n=1 Tax=Herbiconiux moechotypicola TaxID=637393 RepID=A0ABP5QF62_9MICO|nr:methyltransferase [Herbiconiux moechotypicola]MCS5729956.1 methyltransferase [Herbiconiux moechotypicola]
MDRIDRESGSRGGAVADHGLVERLRAGGSVFAEEEAALLADAAGQGAGSTERLEQLVSARVAGEPLEPLIGWAEFAGMRVIVDPGVFVPRRRTEWLAECAVQQVGAVQSAAAVAAPMAAAVQVVGEHEARATGDPRAVVVDLCCGTGAVGAVVAARTGAEVYAADIDRVAVENARRNLPAERVYEGDLFEALPRSLRGRVDVLAVNAPYVPTAAIALMPSEARDHEPRVALDGGTDGLEVHRRVAADARDWLSASGALMIETSEPQADHTAALMQAAGLRAEIRRDDERDATVVIGSVQFL